MAPTNHKFVMTIDLSKSFFVHCLLVVQDLYTGIEPSLHLAALNEWFHDYDVYIGDSSDYLENKKCDGGPFMGLTDPSSFVYRKDLVTNDKFWKYGEEIWCNQ